MKNVNPEVMALVEKLGEEFETEMRRRFQAGQKVDYWATFRLMYECLCAHIASGQLKPPTKTKV